MNKVLNKTKYMSEKVKKIFFKELDSTQVYCRNNYENLLKNEAEGKWVLVVAETQTNGIGQENKKWESSEKNIYCTFIIPIKNQLLRFLGFIPHIAAYSSYELIKSYGINPKIKWVNDILVNNKKISGILCETYSQGNDSVLLIGIGINTNMNTNQIILKRIDQDITSLQVEMQNIVGKNTKEIFVDNNKILEDLQNILYEKMNNILCLERSNEDVNYDEIKSNFFIQICSKLNFYNIAYLNKTVKILKTQFEDDRSIIGKMIGLDEYGFCQIKEKGTNAIYSITKGRLQPIRNYLLGEYVPNNQRKNNNKYFELVSIKYNYTNISHFDKHCNFNWKKTNDYYNYIVEATISDEKKQNIVYLYGDLCEKSIITDVEEEESFKLNLFFDLEKNNFSNLENSRYKEVYLKGIIDPIKEEINITYSSQNKNCDLLSFKRDFIKIWEYQAAEEIVDLHPQANNISLCEKYLKVNRIG